MTLKETILSKIDSDIIPFQVDEWGCQVFLRTWTGTERVEFAKWHTDNKNSHELHAKVCVLSLCDDAGNRLFSDADMPVLMSKSGRVITEIGVASLEHNGISEDAITQAKKKYWEVRKPASSTDSA